MTGFKKTAAEIYKTTIGKVLSWFHLLDKHATKLYENDIICKGKRKRQMAKKYLEKNVLEAALERLDIIFHNFENIYFSVSRRKR